MMKKPIALIGMIIVILWSLAFMAIPQDAGATAGGVLIGPASKDSAISYPFQRKSFSAGGTRTIQPLGTSLWINAIAYGNNIFAAVGGGGTINTSPDGMTWTPRMVGTPEWFSGISYVNGRFIAVGNGGVIYTSPDGINWTAGNSGTGWLLSSITYGNGLYVAAGEQGTLIKSSDGVNWTPATNPGTTAWNLISGIAYGSGLFVAVGHDGSLGYGRWDAVILTSSDGDNWTKVSSGVFNWLNGVIYANNQFVAIGAYGEVITSPDGVAWTERTSGVDLWVILSGITYGNGKYVVVGSDGYIMTSPDGISWTPKASGTMHWLSGIAHGNGRFVATGEGGTVVVFTDPDQQRLWVFYSNGKFLTYRTSSDGGTTWGPEYHLRDCTSGDQFSVWFDGNYVHYAYTDGRKIYYAKGIPSLEGIFLQVTTFPQVAVPSASGITYSLPTIAVDGDGYPWIGYRKTDSTGNYPLVTKSSRSDGTWEGSVDTATGFPIAMESWSAAAWAVVPIPMPVGRMLVIYTSPGHYLRARCWDGYAWRAPVTSNGLPHTQHGVTNNLFSAVAQPDSPYVHLVFLESSVFRYARYEGNNNWWELYPVDSSTFVPEPAIQSGLTSTSAPLLSFDSSGDLHLFWAGAPRKDHIYHKRFTGGQWEELYADWIDENVEELPSNSALTSFDHTDGYVGLFYLTRKSSPYSLKFGGFSSTVPPRPTMANSMSSSPISASFQRKGFWNYGNFWVFYSNGTNMVFQTSDWDFSWSAPTAVRPCTSGEQFSIWADIQYVYYAYANGLPGHALYFRRGTPNFDGTIAWGPEQVVAPAATGVKYSHPTITVDSNGYPWIGYRKVDASNNKFPCLTKSEKSDGTWKAAAGFPYNLEGWTAAYWFVVPVPLEDGKMLALYASHGHRIKAKCWEGGVWHPRIETQFAVPGYSLSAVSAWPFPDGEAYLTYLDGSRILFTKYSFATNSFSLEEVVQNGVTGSSAPVLSYGWGGDLDLFWAGAPYDNHIFYKRNSGGVWDRSFTDWVDENVELLASYDALTSFYFSGNGRGLLYLTRPSPPYNIKFGVFLGGGPT